MAARISEAGQLEPVSLFARFAFTRDELSSAATQWLTAKRQGTAKKPAAVRTFVHELMHYLQYVTTPYGLCLRYCRVLQNEATIAIVNALLGAGCPVRQPLLYNLPNMPSKVADEVRINLSLWLNVEYLVTFLNADTPRQAALGEWFVSDMARVEMGSNPLRPPLLPIPEIFARVQESLADFIGFSNKMRTDLGNPVPMYPDNIDRSAINMALHDIPSDRDRALGRTAPGLSLLGNPWDTSAIIESAASAAEFWDSVSYQELVAWANADVADELKVYRECIRLGLEAIPTRDPQVFLASYMALCDLALSAPLLPQHARLRTGGSGFEELIPSIRFGRLLGTAGRIAPMRTMADHLRYVGELCDDLRWVTPIQIMDSALEGPQVVSDPLSFIYVMAQRWKAQRNSAAFISFDVYLLNTSPISVAWQDLFDFVIIDYKDRTTYHRDKNFLESMTTGYLHTQGLQAVMLGQGLTLMAPYSNDPIEKQWMTEWLQGQFKKLFGREFPDLRYV
jgi:hypothetical protein